MPSALLSLLPGPHQKQRAAAGYGKGRGWDSQEPIWDGEKVTRRGLHLWSINTKIKLLRISRWLCAAQMLSRVWLFVTSWTVAPQTPLSMVFSRLEYCSRLPCPPSGDLPNPGIEPTSLTYPALASGFFTTSASWEVPDGYGRPLNPKSGPPSSLPVIIA